MTNELITGSIVLSTQLILFIKVIGLTAFSLSIIYFFIKKPRPTAWELPRKGEIGESFFQNRFITKEDMAHDREKAA